MNKVRWGILSTAKIGMMKVIPAMQVASNCAILAIASRDAQSAQSARFGLGIPKAYGSYEELLADPEIDAVYNPLPNHLHVPWTVKALEAGKHVLCEKPIALNHADLQALLAAAERFPALKVMEAFMYRFHPQWQKARQLVLEGAIGQVSTIHTLFSYFNDDPANVRNIPEYGGGGLMDIGCYAVSLARFIFDAEPLRVNGIAAIDPQYQVDRMFSGLLDFGERTATFTVGTQLHHYQRVQILGTAGRIEIEIPFNPLPEQVTRIWLTRDQGPEEITFPPVNHYTLQGEAFSRAILENSPLPIPLADAAANMRILDALAASAQSGAWFEL